MLATIQRYVDHRAAPAVNVAPHTAYPLVENDAPAGATSGNPIERARSQNARRQLHNGAQSRRSAPILLGRCLHERRHG